MSFLLRVVVSMLLRKYTNSILRASGPLTNSMSSCKGLPNRSCFRATSRSYSVAVASLLEGAMRDSGGGSGSRC
jgi:hypothetical protein